MEPERILTVTDHDLPDGTVVLTAVGEVDRDSGQELREVADRAFRRGRRRVVLDLAKVTFCDSSGLSLFIDLHRRADADGGWLRMAGLPAELRSMLRVTHLDQLFAVYDTVEAATRS
jgi:anti-sigma B factor antagonist